MIWFFGRKKNKKNRQKKTEEKKETFIRMDTVTEEEEKRKMPLKSVESLKTEEKTKPSYRQCMAITKNGTRCKRRAVEGSVYCKVHQKMFGDK